MVLILVMMSDNAPFKSDNEQIGTKIRNRTLIKTHYEKLFKYHGFDIETRQ